MLKKYFCRELEADGLRSCSIHGTTPPPIAFHLGEELSAGHFEAQLEDIFCKESHPWHHCPEVHKAINGVRFIADHTRREEDSTRVSPYSFSHTRFAKTSEKYTENEDRI